MGIKDILVQIDDSKTAAARFTAAIDLAGAHGAHLTGLCLAVDPPISAIILGLVPPDLMTGQRSAVRAQAEAAAARFRLAAGKAGLLNECRIVQVLDIDAADVFIQHARHSDLIVLSQVDAAEISILGARFPADVVLGSGRPMLSIPYIGPAATLGQRVLIAWDGSREAARAVSDALPILERAHSVTALSVNPDASSNGHRRDPGADIALHLARHGVKVTAARTIAQEISVGDAILADIADNGVDLLVMGAYGRSRLRELVVGGVTRHMFEHMTVPVLMSH